MKLASALVLILVLILALILNAGSEVSVSFRLFEIKDASSALVFFVFSGVGVAIGLLLK
jgi:hypothetical protein